MRRKHSWHRRASELPLQPTEVAGTLANRAVFIKESGLGEEAGLGLFARREFAVGDRITSYKGPWIRSRESSGYKYKF